MLLSPDFYLLTYHVDAEREFGTLKNISGWIIAFNLASSYSRITAHSERVMHQMKCLMVYLKLTIISMFTVLIEWSKSAPSVAPNSNLELDDKHVNVFFPDHRLDQVVPTSQYHIFFVCSPFLRCLTRSPSASYSSTKSSSLKEYHPYCRRRFIWAVRLSMSERQPEHDIMTYQEI